MGSDASWKKHHLGVKVSGETAGEGREILRGKQDLQPILS
jgi:hypothetical protein